MSALHYFLGTLHLFAATIIVCLLYFRSSNNPRHHSDRKWQMSSKRAGLNIPVAVCASPVRESTFLLLLFSNSRFPPLFWSFFFFCCLASHQESISCRLRECLWGCVCFVFETEFGYLEKASFELPETHLLVSSAGTESMCPHTWPRVLIF